MGFHTYKSSVFSKIRNALRVLSRPGKSDRNKSKYIIEPFRGFGSRREAFLMGRVFRQHRIDPGLPEGSISGDLVALWRRLSRKGLRGVWISGRFSDKKVNVRTDKHGFFWIKIRYRQPLKDEILWRQVQLQFEKPFYEGAAPVQGQIFFPTDSARFVVISDIDDTVIHTGVADKIKMLWRLFVQRTQSRTAFPGVAAFYRALHNGVSGQEFNPMLYVSRGPWAIYHVLEEFFHLHQIPIGPILFLRYWGLDVHHPLPHLGKAHKIRMIRTMLDIYDDLPFILIGDSGQKDPEIYAQIVTEHPGRVLAVYIRDIEFDPERRSAIEKLSGRINDAGSRLLVVEDSFAMAEHAANHGFISDKALSNVTEERLLTEHPESHGRIRKQVEGSTVGSRITP